MQLLSLINPKAVDKEKIKWLQKWQERFELGANEYFL